MASFAPIEVKRHYTKLSAKETEEVVHAVADLVVAFFMTDYQPGPNDFPETQAARFHPRDSLGLPVHSTKSNERSIER